MWVLSVNKSAVGKLVVAPGICVLGTEHCRSNVALKFFVTAGALGIQAYDQQLYV